jgi:hypothetical protein
MPAEELSWWNFNIPINERTAECPDFLLNISEKDRRIIGSWDLDFERLSWEEVKELIGMRVLSSYIVTGAILSP